MNKRACEQTSAAECVSEASEQTSEWSITNISILRGFESQWFGGNLVTFSLQQNLIGSDILFRKQVRRWRRIDAMHFVEPVSDHYSQKRGEREKKGYMKWQRQRKRDFLSIFCKLYLVH